MSDPVILICGDSLAMPRENLPFIRTWPALLQARSQLLVVNRSQYSSTSRKLAGPDMLEYYQPSVTILEVGICDAAPRLLGVTAKSLVARLPESVRKLFLKALKKVKRRDSSNVLVPAEEFRRNISNYVDRAIHIGVEAVVIVKILRPGRKYLAMNPEVANNVMIYNSIIEDIASYYRDRVVALDPVDLDADVDSLTQPDGYHLNESGHQALALLLQNCLDLRKMKP